MAYNSCRNRHCAKCQGKTRREWLARLNEFPLLRVHAAGRDRRNRSRSRRPCTRSCSRRPPRRCAPSPQIPDISAPAGLIAVLQAGARTPPIILTSIASSRRRHLRRWRAMGRLPAGSFQLVPVLWRLFRRLFPEELRAAYYEGGLGLLRRSRSWQSLMPSSPCSPRLVASTGRLRQAALLRDEAGAGYLGRYAHRVAIA
ncbi:transposase [Mesorhizobium sp. LMG 17147]|uniref:transposase n=1 Tax=Mesorhizobium sp. LMG 17147 TaxID=2963091 RepID=UPI0020C98FAF|nr:transposase [Mesorhizobium sp. LMG 17147]